jgi:hypothetical protein
MGHVYTEQVVGKMRKFRAMPEASGPPCFGVTAKLIKLLVAKEGVVVTDNGRPVALAGPPSSHVLSTSSSGISGMGQQRSSSVWLIRPGVWCCQFENTSSSWQADRRTQGHKFWSKLFRDVFVNTDGHADDQIMLVKGRCPVGALPTPLPPLASNAFPCSSC